MTHFLIGMKNDVLFIIFFDSFFLFHLRFSHCRSASMPCWIEFDLYYLLLKAFSVADSRWWFFVYFVCRNSIHNSPRAKHCTLYTNGHRIHIEKRKYVSVSSGGRIFYTYKISIHIKFIKWKRKKKEIVIAFGRIENIQYFFPAAPK